MITIRGHAAGADVNALSFGANGRLLASSGADGFVKVWEVARFAEGTSLWEAEDGVDEMYHLQFSPDGRRLFACGDDGTPRAWTAAGEHLGELGSGPRGLLNHSSVLVCSTDGRFVAWTGGFLNRKSPIVSARVADRGFHRRFRGHDNAIGILAAGPDGLVSGSADRRIRFWDWDSGRMYHELTLRGYVRTLAVSRAGDRLAASCAGTVYVWPLERSPRRARRVPGRRASCAATRAPPCAWTSRPTARHWPPSPKTARSACGTWRVASRCARSR